MIRCIGGFKDQHPFPVPGFDTWSLEQGPGVLKEYTLSRPNLTGKILCHLRFSICVSSAWMSWGMSRHPRLCSQEPTCAKDLEVVGCAVQVAGVPRFCVVTLDRTQVHRDPAAIDSETATNWKTSFTTGLERKPRDKHQVLLSKDKSTREGFQKILSMNVHDRRGWCDVGDYK